MQERSGPAARTALVGAAAVCLLAVVALASRGRFAGGGGTSPSHGLLDWAYSAFLVCFVVAVPVALWAYAQQLRNEREQRAHGKRRRRMLWQALVFLAFALAAAGLTHLHHSGLQTLHRVPFVTGGKLPAGRARPLPAPARFEWPVLGVAVALGLAAAAVLAVRRRPARSPRADAAVAQELALALDSALEDVLAEGDPRRAVIKAYAAMEGVLAAHGLPRSPPEAPYEYLERALGQLDAGASSLRRLTDLYERAKFSVHAIDAGMRAEAIAALTAVRDELRS